MGAEVAQMDAVGRLGVAIKRIAFLRSALEKVVDTANQLSDHAALSQGGIDGWNHAEANGAQVCADVARDALEWLSRNED